MGLTGGEIAVCSIDSAVIADNLRVGAGFAVVVLSVVFGWTWSERENEDNQ